MISLALFIFNDNDNNLLINTCMSAVSRQCSSIQEYSHPENLPTEDGTEAQQDHCIQL